MLLIDEEHKALEAERRLLAGDKAIYLIDKGKDDERQPDTQNARKCLFDIVLLGQQRAAGDHQKDGDGDVCKGHGSKGRKTGGGRRFVQTDIIIGVIDDDQKAAQKAQGVQTDHSAGGCFLLHGVTSLYVEMMSSL